MYAVKELVFVLIFFNRDCPAECKEAIQSLIYAAARFSDLPELRELRSLFTGKFGNSLELYISKEVMDGTTLIACKLFS